MLFEQRIILTRTMSSVQIESMKHCAERKAMIAAIVVSISQFSSMSNKRLS